MRSRAVAVARFRQAFHHLRPPPTAAARRLITATNPSPNFFTHTTPGTLFLSQRHFSTSRARSRSNSGTPLPNWWIRLKKAGRFLQEHYLIGILFSYVLYYLDREVKRKQHAEELARMEKGLAMLMAKIEAVKAEVKAEILKELKVNKDETAEAENEFDLL